jgi:hypothetical protein
MPHRDRKGDPAGVDRFSTVGQQLLAGTINCGLNAGI